MVSLRRRALSLGLIVCFLALPIPQLISHNLGLARPASVDSPLANLMGPFKGMVAGLKWIDVYRSQRSYQYEEVDRLTREICHLQPYIVEGWDYLSWNLAFNLYVEAGEDWPSRLQWLKKGLDQLDLGLEYNPSDPLLLFSKATTLYLRGPHSEHTERFLLERFGRHHLLEAADLILQSGIIESGDFNQASMGVAILRDAQRFDEAIEACRALIKRFPGSAHKFSELLTILEIEKQSYVP